MSQKRIVRCGETGLILYGCDAEASRLAKALDEAAIPGVLECWPSYETVGIHLDPSTFDLARLEAALDSVELGATPKSRLHTVPVCYEMGEDLDAVASALGLSTDEVVACHASLGYQCRAIGFCPGFPYLGPLPKKLHGVPRREQPRVRVPAGSVGITGSQTGIYPSERPGGWALVGRTPLVIASLEDEFFPIAAGDLVRFVPISKAEYEELNGQRLESP